MSPTQNQTDHGAEKTIFIAFVQVVLGRAASWTKEKSPRTLYQRHFQFVGTSQFNEPVVPIPDYDSWLRGHLDEIAAIAETQDCIRELWASGAARFLLPKQQRLTPTDQLTDEQMHNLASGILYALADVLRRSGSFEPPRELILDTYARFQAAWTATATRHTAVIPLLNFRSEVTEPLRLSSHYVLSPITDEEKAWVWGVMTSYRESGLIPFHNFIRTEFKLVAEWSLPDLHRSDDQEQAIKEHTETDVAMLHDLRNVVTVLRLTKPGDVAVTSYAQQTDEVPPFGGYPSLRTLGMLWSDFEVRRQGSDYTLETADIASVQALLTALEQLDNRPARAGLDVALRRFNQSYSREYYEDRLIDLTIALESTLLADGTGRRPRLTHRFTQHGAALLAGRHRPRGEVEDFLRAMYNARSAVVHSRKSLSEMEKSALCGLEWREFVQACEDVTRDILAEYVRELRQRPDSSVQSITKGLEARVVEGLASASDG